MNRFIDLLSLLKACVSRAGDDRANFMGVVIAAIVVAVLFWLGCKYSMLLWNRRFRMRTFHHLVCGFAGAVGLVFIILFYSLNQLEMVAADTVDQWQATLADNKEWQTEVLSRGIWEAINSLDPQPTAACGNYSKPDGKSVYEASTRVDMHASATQTAAVKDATGKPGSAFYEPGPAGCVPHTH